MPRKVSVGFFWFSTMHKCSHCLNGAYFTVSEQLYASLIDATTDNIFEYTDSRGVVPEETELVVLLFFNVNKGMADEDNRVPAPTG